MYQNGYLKIMENETTMTKRKRGRPAKVKTQEEKILSIQNPWDRTSYEKKLSMGLIYLGMNANGISNETKTKFLNKIKETPLEDFDHTGWSIYKNILTLVS